MKSSAQLLDEITAWIIGSIAIAFFLWFSGAKTQKREREARQRELDAKEHERVVMRRFDELTQLLAKPDTTLEDVKVLVGDQAHFEGMVVDRNDATTASHPHAQIL